MAPLHSPVLPSAGKMFRRLRRGARKATHGRRGRTSQTLQVNQTPAYRTGGAAASLPHSGWSCELQANWRTAEAHATAGCLQQLTQAWEAPCRRPPAIPPWPLPPLGLAPWQRRLQLHAAGRRPIASPQGCSSRGAGGRQACARGRPVGGRRQRLRRSAEERTPHRTAEHRAPPRRPAHGPGRPSS